jgi:hypothetical protein
LPKQERKKIHTGFYIFHGIEVLICLFLLGIYFSKFFILIAIGFSFHLIIDLFDEFVKKGTLDKISLIYSYYRFRKLSKH